MKYFCSLVFVVSSLLIFSPIAEADTSNISNLVFTTATQTIKPGVISEEIKVQTQNSGGTAESVSETNDVTFTSTSPTGEFLNSTGSAVSKTMSKNTSSRTFFYRDSATGVFEINVSIKGRETGTTFNTSQSITISNTVIIDEPDGGGTSTTTATTTPSTATTTSSVTTSTGTSQTLSVHSSTQTITYIVPKVEPKADAGRYRLTTTNSPIEFEAEDDGFGTVGKISYNWSFGDGKSESGKIVSHTYAFPGDYVVVLNIVNNADRAVSRAEVKVVDPDVHIVSTRSGVGGFVELKNNSEYEVNIQDWKLQGGVADLIFPKDTIIKSGGSVKFPFDSLSEGTPISLSYSNGLPTDVAESSLFNTFSYTEPTREEIEIAKQKVARQFALENSRASSDSQISNSTALNSEILNTEISGQENTDSTTGTLSIIDSLDTTKKDDNSSLLATPVRMFNFLKNFFTR